MPPKTTQSLEDLRIQARLTFRYWPIYLQLRLREVEQHLSPSERQALGSKPAQLAPKNTALDLSILLEYGLWKEDEIVPEIAEPPNLAVPAAESYFFRVGTSLSQKGFLKAFISLDAVAVQQGTVLRLELLRVRLEDAEHLNLAGKLFNRISVELSVDVALEAARLWALLHGARLLQWGTVPSHYLAQFAPQVLISEPPPPSTNGKHPSLPPRKRGKGVFRDPS
jgi:hypothetical protein